MIRPNASGDSHGRTRTRSVWERAVDNHRPLFSLRRELDLSAIVPALLAPPKISPPQSAVPLTATMPPPPPPPSSPADVYFLPPLSPPSSPADTNFPPLLPASTYDIASPPQGGVAGGGGAEDGEQGRGALLAAGEGGTSWKESGLADVTHPGFWDVAEDALGNALFCGAINVFVGAGVYCGLMAGGEAGAHVLGGGLAGAARELAANLVCPAGASEERRKMIIAELSHDCSSLRRLAAHAPVHKFYDNWMSGIELAQSWDFDATVRPALDAAYELTKHTAPYPGEGSRSGAATKVRHAVRNQLNLHALQDFDAHFGELYKRCPSVLGEAALRRISPRKEASGAQLAGPSSGAVDGWWTNGNANALLDLFVSEGCAAAVAEVRRLVAKFEGARHQAVLDSVHGPGRQMELKRSNATRCNRLRSAPRPVLELLRQDLQWMTSESGGNLRRFFRPIQHTLIIREA
jgi:hypothetical protein